MTTIKLPITPVNAPAEWRVFVADYGGRYSVWLRDAAGRPQPMGKFPAEERDVAEVAACGLAGLARSL